MTELTSKIPGMQYWTYDYARRPDQTLVSNTPKKDSYNVDISNGVINPVTQQPTVFQGRYINETYLICDNKHKSNGASIQVLTYYTSSSTKPSGGVTVPTDNNYSFEKYTGQGFDGAKIVVQSTSTATSDVSYSDFTTTTPGIKILYQTGIVPNGNGNSAIIFEVETGYKIPADTIIKVTPAVENTNLGGETKGTPTTFPLSYEISPGIYMMTTTLDNSNVWTTADIDFLNKEPTSPEPTSPEPTSPEPEPVEHSSVTFILSHCTVTPNDTNVENGIHSWTFTADPGYVFDETGGIMDDNTGGIGDEIAATNTNVTYLNNYNVTKDINISLDAHKQQVTTIKFVQILNHVRSNVTSDLISRTLNSINLTADTGYVFQTDIQILLYSGDKVVSEYNIKGNNTDNITIPLNTTTENTITDNMDKVQMTASAILTTSNGGYEHNYLITDTELSAFSNDRLWKSVDETYNVSQYIDNLIELPFKVETPTTVNQISVGNVKSNIVSHETNTRFVTLDLGTINVPAKYNNGYDYQNNTIKLYVPFGSPININNENAINQTIHIVYNVDISNGDLTVNLYNGDVLFFTGTNNISTQIPFLNTVKNTVIKQDNHFNDNDIRKPYIIISRETPILNSDYYPTNERGLIKNYNGNIQVQLLNNMNIPNDELSELTNQLERGIKYVKSN